MSSVRKRRCCSLILPLALCGFLTLGSFSTVAGADAEDGRPYRVELVANGDVIAREGPKTGFPSVVRVPDWLAVDERAHPTAQYYLYYGTHHGDHIPMKWAASLDGPWEEFDLGGRFNSHSRRGVFDTRSDPTRVSYGHVAAPDVHVDHANRRFILFYHGENQPATTSPHGISIPQRHENFVATSRDGLNFNDPLHCGGQPGHGPQTVTVDGVTRDVWVGSEYQRAFQFRGEWYSLSKRAVMAKARDRENPFLPPENDPFGMAWLETRRPTSIWRDDASKFQRSYFSPAAAFLASSEFAEHPHNPNPNCRILSHDERLNHLSLCLLPDNQLEIFFYVRCDEGDRYNAIYRIVYDIRDPDFQRWDVARDATGQVIFDVAVTPEEVAALAEASHRKFNPIYHADPVSLGSSGLFVDADGQKYLFFAYVSGEFSGDEGEGQIAAVRLVPDPPHSH